MKNTGVTFVQKFPSKLFAIHQVNDFSIDVISIFEAQSYFLLNFLIKSNLILNILILNLMHTAKQTNF